MVINGANLNMLGKREPELYGEDTLEDINNFLASSFPKVKFEFFQSNYEGVIVEKIQQADCDAVIINAAAHTHYSIAIRDAVLIRKDLPFVEVHLTDPKSREEFRKVSLLEDVCLATFAGKKKYSYFDAVKYLLDLQKEKHDGI